MHLSEESFQLAHTDFFEAFKCFDEAGSPRRISSLKYLGKGSYFLNAYRQKSMIIGYNVTVCSSLNVDSCQIVCFKMSFGTEFDHVGLGHV